MEPTMLLCILLARITLPLWNTAAGMGKVHDCGARVGESSQKDECETPCLKKTTGCQ